MTIDRRHLYCTALLFRHKYNEQVNAKHDIPAAPRQNTASSE